MSALFVVLGLLALLAVWVSLPLFPAILIYRLFPNTPLVANGPLANLTINTGGAFAAYLIVFLLVIPLVNTTKDVIGSSMRAYWEIRGEVSLIDETGKEIEALDQLLNDMRLRTKPDNLFHEGNTLRLKIPEESAGRLPKIVISFPSSDWGSRNLEFDESTPWWMFWKWGDHKPTIDPFSKTIDIGKISIQKLPRPQTYNSTLGMERGVGPAIR